MPNGIKDKLQFFPLFLCVKFDKPKIDGFSSFSKVEANGNDKTNKLDSYINNATLDQKKAFRRAVRYNLLNIKDDNEDIYFDDNGNLIEQEGIEDLIDLNCKWYLISAKTLKHAKEKLKNCIQGSSFKVINNDNEEYEYAQNEYHIYFDTLEKNFNSLMTLPDIENIKDPQASDDNIESVNFVDNGDNPSDVTIKIYQSAIFEIFAEGINCNVYYKWQISSDNVVWQNLNNGQYYSGVDTNKLIVSPSDNIEFNEKYFRCKIFNDAETDIKYSQNAQLFISNYLITIESQPDSEIDVVEGQNQVLEIVATGNNLTYQWQYKTSEDNYFQNITNSMNNYNGATSNKLTIYNINFDLNNYTFQCVITDDSNNQVKPQVLLKVISKDNLRIIEQPEDLTIISGETANFSITVESNYEDSIISYQWFYYTSNNNGPSNYYNSNQSILQFDTHDATYDNYKYGCSVESNKGGSIISDLATLTIRVVGEIAIENQPDLNQTIIAGDTISFTITATNVKLYQWQISLDGGNTWEELYNTNYNGNSVTIFGAKTKTLKITTTGQAYSWNGTQYKCILSNDDDHIEESNPITLTIEEYNK